MSTPCWLANGHLEAGLLRRRGVCSFVRSIWHEEVDVDVIFGRQVGFARGACAVQFEGSSTQDDDDSCLD